MEINAEQFTMLIAAGFGLVRIIEVLVTKGFDLIVKRKPLSTTDSGNVGIKSELKLMNENHLTHIQEAIERGTSCSSEEHKRQIEVLIKIATILEERR